MNYVDFNGNVVTTTRYWVIPGAKAAGEWRYPSTQF